MRSQTLTLSPTTSEQSLTVSYTRGEIVYKPSLYVIKNTSNATILVKLLSNEDVIEMEDYPGDFGFFEIYSNKEYSLSYPKYFDIMIYKAATAPSSGGLILSILDYENLVSP